MKSITSKAIVAAVILSLLAAGVYTILISNHSKPGKASATEQGAREGMGQPAARLVVDEPFENIKPKTEALRIEDPSRPSIHTLSTGTVLRVPANAFADADGNTITAPVQLTFREFHSAAEIIASGIPMRIPKADGEEEWLQTAGMYEINGASGGRPVDIAEGKAIEVDLLSKTGGAYDFWIFGRESGRWENQGAGGEPKEDAAALEEARRAVEELRGKTAAPPVAPEPTPEAEKLIFTDLDAGCCPELAGRKPLALTYAGNDEKTDPKNNQWITDPGIWRKKTLQYSDTEGVYQLTLLGNEVYRIPVRLALEGKNLEQARRDYQAALASYQANFEMLRNAEAMLARQAAFRRTMSVSGFGIYNYDILWKREDSVPLIADFRFGELPEAVKQYVTVYLVTGDNRAVVGLPQSDWSQMRISPSADNKLIAVLPGDKVAVFSQSDFNREMEDIRQASGSRYVFDMRVEPEPLNSMESLEQLLQRASS